MTTGSRHPVRTNDRRSDPVTDRSHRVDRFNRFDHPDRKTRLGLERERHRRELLELGDRLERVESRVALLETTLRGVARETGVSIGCPCDRCDRSYLLVSDGLMRCPSCGYRQSI